MKLGSRMRIVPLHDDAMIHERATKIARKLEPIFQKVRNDPQLGRGSCSHVDEAMTDDELVAWLSDLEDDLGPEFTWPRVRRILIDDERELWARVGIAWPPREG